MPVTIDDLLSNPFRARRDEEKLQIVLEGRPCAILPSIINAINGKKDISKQLRTVQYESIPWLTACEKRTKLFCWPCLLFITEKGAWNYSGFNGQHFNSSILKHEKSLSHVQAVMDLHMFSKQVKVPALKNCTDQLKVAKHNDMVQRNRDVLKRIIDVFCYLIEKQQPSTNKMERYCHLSLDDCVELLQLIQNYDVLYLNYIDDAIDLLRKSPSIFEVMIHAFSTVLKHTIKEEVQGSSFVSIILSETSDISTKSQISTVLRYVKDAKIYERFIGFTNITEYRSSDVLFKHISKIVDDFQIAKKFVGQAYDGAIASSNQLKDLIFKVRLIYPYAVFVPCYIHEFERVLQQSLSHIKECEIFFKTLNGIAVYFSEKTRRWQALEDFITDKFQSLKDYKCSCLKNHIARVARNHRKQFVEFFESVVDNSEKWDAEDIIKARGFFEFLQKLQTVFLLEIFSKVFFYTEILGKALKSETPESVFNNKKINEVKKCLQDDNEYGFEIIWANVITEILNSDVSKPKRLKLDFDRESKLQQRELFHKIIDYLLQQIDFRCNTLSKLEFFQLLNHQNYPKNYQKFPDGQVDKLFLEYAGIFDSYRLKNELRVLFSHIAFSDKKIPELLEFLVKENLTSNFPEISKLAQLILTLPCKTTRVNCASSTMANLVDWCYIAENNDSIKNDLSFLCVEKNLLSKIKEEGNFYENVVNEFAKQNKYLELMYK